MTSFAVSFDGHGPRGRSLFQPSPLAANAATRAALLCEAAATPEPFDGYGMAKEHGCRFDGAVALYERGQWQDAFTQLARLADGGHAPAAKLALLMLRYGDVLYGVTLRADPLHIARWASLVLDAGKCKAAVVACQADRRVSLDDMPEQRPAARPQFQRATSRATASPSSITAMA